MTLTRCTAANTHAPLPMSYYFMLEELPDEATVLHYLSRVYGPVSCKELALTRCAGLSPDVLRALGRPLAAARNEGEDEVWMCPDIDSLDISGAPLIGSADVRAVFEPRFALHAAAGFADNFDPNYVVASLKTLHVCECGPLSEEDKEWFNTHLVFVTWDNWRGGAGFARPGGW